jgi:hypothetical protein
MSKVRRYTQSGAWTLDTSDRAFGMVLGHRVRKLLSTPRVRQNIGAQHDLERILFDMCCVSKTRGTKLSAAAQLEKFRRTVHHHSVDDLLHRYPRISHTDLTLAKSMCKQLLTERQKLSQMVLGGARWRPFPAPGYWDLSAAIGREQAAAEELENHHHNLPPPVHKLAAQKGSTKNQVHRNSGPEREPVLSGHHALHGQNAPVIPVGEDRFGTTEMYPYIHKARYAVDSEEEPVPSGLHILHGQNTSVILEGEQYVEPGMTHVAGRHRSHEDEAVEPPRHRGERPGERERDPVPVSPLPGMEAGSRQRTFSLFVVKFCKCCCYFSQEDCRA